MHRTTPKLNINYFISPNDVTDYNARKFGQLDKRVEVEYVTRLRYDCQTEVNTRERLIQEAQGWFFPDVEKMKLARSLELKSCQQLESLKTR